MELPAAGCPGGDAVASGLSLIALPALTHPESTLDWSDWRTVLDGMRSDGPDYLSCLNAFESSLQIRLSEACRALGPEGTGANAATPPEVTLCIAGIQAATDALRRRHAEANQAAFARSAPAPVQPMDPTSELRSIGSLGALGSGEALRQTRDSCSLPVNDAARAIALSAEFVDGRLPGLMNEPAMNDSCRSRIVASYLDAAAQAFPRATPMPDGMRRLVQALRAYVPSGERARYDEIAACFSESDPFAVLRALETEV